MGLYFTFCRVCECRLNTVEEWSEGRCVEHSVSPQPQLAPAKEYDWNALLEAIDASDPRREENGRAMNRDA